MAAGEDEPQAVVLDLLRCPGRVGLGDLREPPGELRLQGGEMAAAAEGIDRLEAPGGHQPRPRVVRDTVPRPTLDGYRKRLVKHFLGQVEVPHQPEQGGEDAAGLGAVDLVDQCANVCRA